MLKTTSNDVMIMVMINTIMIKGPRKKSLTMLVAALAGLSAAQSMAIAILRYSFCMMMIIMTLTKYIV